MAQKVVAMHWDFRFCPGSTSLSLTRHNFVTKHVTYYSYIDTPTFELSRVAGRLKARSRQLPITMVKRKSEVVQWNRSNCPPGGDKNFG